MMDSESIAQLIKSKLRTGTDGSSMLNQSELAKSPAATQAALNSLIEDYNIRLRTGRHEIASNAILNKFRDLGNATQRLDKRLQSHIQLLRRNELSFSGTNDVLEYDAAKTRSDKLIEVINAKNTWNAALRVADMLNETEQNELFNYLVTLQQANKVLSQYVPSHEREQTLETRKDSFFSWFPSAISFAIDNEDVQQLAALKEKYTALDREEDFKKAFSAAIKTKITTYLTKNQADLTLWQLLDEAFSVWKRTNKMATHVLGDKASDYVAWNCYEGMRSQDDIVEEVLKRVVVNSENMFVAAKELSNTRKDFLDYTRTEGDQSIGVVIGKLCDDFYQMISEDYAKHVKSLVFMKIDKLAQTANQKNSRKHDWVQPLLEEVHASMREVVNEAFSTFGIHFSKYVVPTLEKAVDQLNSTFRKSDILSSRMVADKSTTQSAPSMDELGDSMTCLCIAGYLLNIITDLNAFIAETHASAKGTDSPRDSLANPYIIRNRAQLERYVKRVVQEKITTLASTLVDPMISEMAALKESANVSDPSDKLKISLPNFSIPPHNYITVVGHGLLHQMNTLSSYNSDSNFRTAILVAANCNEDECDLWMFRSIVAILMDRFVENVGEPKSLPLKVARQFNADIVFLLDALQDLRLEPSPALTQLAEKLSEATPRQQ